MKQIRSRFARALPRLNLVQKFTLASFAIVAAGAIILSWWLGDQIRLRSIQEATQEDILHAKSLIMPHLTDHSSPKTISPHEAEDIDDALEVMRRGHPIAALKVWGTNERVLYSSSSLRTGDTYPEHEELARAWQGEVVSTISDLQDPDNQAERSSYAQLAETYIPVRLNDAGPIVVVVEFYEDASHLLAEISAAQTESRLVVASIMLVIYALLIIFVRRADKTIGRQQLQLEVRLTELTMVVNRNEALNAQVRRAAASVVAVNEQFLRRIGSELHDGVAQNLSLALLRVDRAVALCEASATAGLGCASALRELSEIQGALQEGLREARSLASGLVLPHVGDLTLAETLAEVVLAHERRTGTRVELNMRDLPERIAVPAQVTVYRFVQEALNNAFRHARGIGQQVQVRVDEGALIVEVSDQGEGFDPTQATDGDNQLGLIGMRERVESLGGAFCVETSLGQGTRVIASVPMTIEAIVEK